MRGQKEVIIDIDPDGNCSIEGKGFVGPECGKFLAEIEEVLGTDAVHTDKPEYTQRRVIKQRNTQRGGR